MTLVPSVVYDLQIESKSKSKEDYISVMTSPCLEDRNWLSAGHIGTIVHITIRCAEPLRTPVSSLHIKQFQCWREDHQNRRAMNQRAGQPRGAKIQVTQDSSANFSPAAKSQSPILWGLRLFLLNFLFLRPPWLPPSLSPPPPTPPPASPSSRSPTLAGCL